MKKTKASRIQNPKRLHKEIRVKEDWYPTVNGKVMVSFYEMPFRIPGVTSPSHWRVCVWGGDDFGMEKDFPEEGYREAIGFYHSIPSGVTKAWLQEKGMVRA